MMDRKLVLMLLKLSTAYKCILSNFTVLPFSVKSEKCKVGYDSAAEWCFMLQLQGKSALGAAEICNKTGGRIALLDSYKKIEILRTYINGKVLNSLMLIYWFVCLGFSFVLGGVFFIILFFIFISFEGG